MPDTRGATVALLLLGSAIAVAQPAALTSEQAKTLTKRGYTTPAVLFDSTIRIVSAKKKGKERLVVLGATGQLVDAGVRGTGTLTVTAPATTSVGAPGATLVEVSYDVPGTAGASTSSAKLWVVREDGTIACSVEGSSARQLGTTCGSSGWTTATPTLSVDANGATVLDVRYDTSGVWSEAKSGGGCQSRSPVRSSQAERWILSARGQCKKGKRPLPRDVID